MASGGIYRIAGVEFPAPVTEWQQQVIGPGLDGYPILCSYSIHVWSWPGGGLESYYMEMLLDKFFDQASTRAQVGPIETDPYDASGGCEEYGTTTYTDAILLNVTPVRRGLPHYDDPEVTFEVYVG